MKHLFTFLLLMIATLAISQSRGGDCQCYQGDVLEDGQEQVVVIEPAKTVTRIIPAVYETKQIRIMIQPATTTSDINCPTCVVENPAIYETVNITTEVAPEMVITETTPAVTKVFKTKYIKYRGRFVTKPAAECGQN